MSGFELRAPEMTRLSDVVEALRTPSDVPVPWEAVEQLRHLLRADSVGLTSLDSAQPRVVFEQYVDLLIDPATTDPRGFETETLSEARNNPFWQRYWDPVDGCSYPDRTGDYDWVNRASDEAGLRERRASSRYDASWFSRGLLTACLPGTRPGRYTRIRIFRRDADFTDREVFLVKLLKPHFEVRLSRSLATMCPSPPLTPRQLEVVRMLEAGLTNRQIARRLRVSEGTVHVHLTNVYRRLGVQGRTAAVHAVFDGVRFGPATPNASHRA